MRATCPECDSHETRKVHVEWMTDRVEETRVCDGCGGQYVNDFGNMIQRVEEVPS
jgi:hypothetical protein